MDDFEDRRDRRYEPGSDTFGVHSTAGAVPVRNKKGEISMQKVKVQRYISGKRPDYARGKTSETESEDSDDDDFSSSRRKPGRYQRHHDGDEDEEELGDQRIDQDTGPSENVELDMNDPRIRRLMAAKNRDDDESDGSGENRISRHRRIHEPEVLSDEEEDNDVNMESNDSSSGDELEDEDIEKRRYLMRQKAIAKAQIGIDQEEIMDKEAEVSGTEGSDSDETSDEETTDSDEEEGARLKPVFVRRKDRLTVQEKEREEAKQRQQEREAKQMAELRRRDTLRMVEESVRQETAERKINANDPAGLADVVTDDENAEVEYEAWKLRELKRLKRERDEQEAREKELAEIERLRNLTEEERRLELKLNPKHVTNKAAKGKYKFLQKYYHRGAFYLDKEESVFSRDSSAPTLEDKFDKTVLPKVMQVKNFGRSGRTKYTHLVDQDTTSFESPWMVENSQNRKFQIQHAAGTRSGFEKPSTKKKK